jgi:hypothetical protein
MPAGISKPETILLFKKDCTRILLIYEDLVIQSPPNEIRK